MILECVAFFEKLRREAANLDAIVHARGWTGLFNGFAGDKGSRVEPQEFLPFPPEDSAATKSNRVSATTARIYLKLLHNNRLPAIVQAAFGGLHDEMEALAKPIP